MIQDIKLLCPKDCIYGTNMVHGLKLKKHNHVQNYSLLIKYNNLLFKSYLCANYTIPMLCGEHYLVM